MSAVTLGYSSAGLSTATHTNLATLDRVQNQALRFISGAMKTTPTSACEIECNIEPLDICRDAAIVTTYERYQRLEHHPNKALIQTWRKKTRIKQQSYLTRAITLLPVYNLPCSREKIATVTDSQSATHAIAQMQHHEQPIVTDILTTANKLHNHNDVETSIQWIPEHCDTPGNDRADKLARQGTSKTQHDEQVSYATSMQIVQTKSRKIWHDRWACGNTGRLYYQHQQTPNQTDPINQLHRAHQTAIFCLRTHHAPLNAHLHRIKKEHQAKCVYYPNNDEPVEHFLFHCPLYDNIRFIPLPAQPNIHNTLYGSTTQLQ